MFKRFNFFQKSSDDTLAHTLENADDVYKKIVTQYLSDLGIDLSYQYSTKEAVEELGLDDELVHQLLEDYVSQIIKSTLQFEQYLEKLRQAQAEQKELYLTAFRDLAHKNLGVARNLRIKDAEILLYELMKKDDIEYLAICLEALKMSSVKLKPKCAYNTLKLIQVKSSL